jgi:hypothetical protein
MPMPIPPDPRSPPMLVDSPERIGQHTLQCSQKWQQQKKKKKKKKAPNRPQMDWELVHTGCRVSGCRVRLSCRFVVSVCRVDLSCSISSLPPCLPSFLPPILPILPILPTQILPNLSPQSIDRITRRTRYRSNLQQESITGQQDARRQSACRPNNLREVRAQRHPSTWDGVEKRLAFTMIGVSDLSRPPGAHRRQKAARASLAKRSEDR